MVTPIVELQAVSRHHDGPPPVVAVDGVDLRVDAGEYVAVMGPSGSGKSSLLHIVGLLDRPTSGRVLIRGLDASRCSERERVQLRAAHIGFVFQAFHLLPHATVAENVGMGLAYAGISRPDRPALVDAVLERVGMRHRAGFTPSTLSGGEGQRVAIARALVHRPSLLLADEPTGNLDSANARSVLELIDELHADGTTIVLITHDPEVGSRAGRTVRIVDGRLAPDATGLG